MFKTQVIAAMAAAFLFSLSSFASAEIRQAISLNLVGPKGDVSEGEAIPLHLSLANQSVKTVVYGEGLGYRTEVIDQNGIDVSAHSRNSRLSPPSDSIPLKNMLYQLAPGETRSIRMQWIPAKDFGMNGEYHIRVCRWDEELKAEACSNSVTVHVAR
jgi:hypothetical protein